MYGYVWLSMVTYGYVWLCMVMYGYIWLGMVMYGYLWLCMVIYGYVWLCMVMYGCQCLFNLTNFNTIDSSPHEKRHPPSIDQSNQMNDITSMLWWQLVNKFKVLSRSFN